MPGIGYQVSFCPLDVQWNPVRLDIMNKHWEICFKELTMFMTAVYSRCDSMVGADWSRQKLNKRQELLLTLKELSLTLYLEATIVQTQQFSLNTNSAYWTWIKYITDPVELESVYARSVFLSCFIV